MDRRKFLSATAASLVAGAAAPRFTHGQTPQPTLPPGWRLFEIITRVTLNDALGAA